MKTRAFSAAICLALLLPPTTRAASVAVVEFVSSTTNQGAFLPQPQDATVYRLIAGQNMVAGTVTVFSTLQGQLVVTYKTTGVWTIRETHLELALQPKDFPQTKQGNPQPGHFDYGGAQARGTTAIQYVFNWGPSVAPGSSLYVGAHAVVTGNGTQTAWSEGSPFAGSNWFTYSTFVRPASAPPISVSKRFLPEEQWIDYDGEFVVEVTNNGPEPTGPIVVTDTLNDLFVDVRAFVESSGGDCTLSGASLSCTLNPIQVGGTAVVRVGYHLKFIRMTEPGSLENCATATTAGSSVQGCATLRYIYGPG